MCKQLTVLFDGCADKLIEAVREKATGGMLKSVLKSGLKGFNRNDYDTEEKEFICDLFLELAAIVNVDFKDNLQKWQYGSALAALMKLQAFLKPEKTVRILKQPCTRCATALESHILRMEQGIPDATWFVVKCNNCGEFNLLSPGPMVKEMRFGNYQSVESLSKDDYTYEQALIRLEQIKYFRK